MCLYPSPPLPSPTPPPSQVVSAKLLFSQVSETSMNSSDNSTDSSEGSPTGHLDGPNIDMEKMLPSVVCIHSVCVCVCVYPLSSLNQMTSSIPLTDLVLYYLIELECTMHTHTYTHTYIYTHTLAHAYTHAHTHAHTHTHTHTLTHAHTPTS